MTLARIMIAAIAMLAVAGLLAGCDSYVEEGKRLPSSCVIMDAGGREAACSCFVEEGVIQCNICMKGAPIAGFMGCG